MDHESVEPKAWWEGRRGLIAFAVAPLAAPSGIVHVLKSGCRWCDCPPEYDPAMTIYNRFVRWAERGIWENLFRELAGNGRCADTQMIDSTHVKAHRSASGGKGGSRNRLLVAREVGATRRFMHSQMLKGALSPSS
jgi:transposase